jgi:hypothetical protein
MISSILRGSIQISTGLCKICLAALRPTRLGIAFEESSIGANALVCGSHGNSMRLRSWYCLMTHHKQERLAAKHLEQQGFTTWLPLRPGNPPRVDKEGAPILYPMFSGYLFCSWPAAQRWHPILSTRGVKGFLGISRERPQPLPLGVIESLQDHVDATTSALIPGLEIKIISGSWAGQTGVVHSTDGELVRLLLSIFHKEVVVTFERRDLRRAHDG